MNYAVSIHYECNKSNLQIEYKKIRLARQAALAALKKNQKCKVEILQETKNGWQVVEVYRG